MYKPLTCADMSIEVTDAEKSMLWYAVAEHIDRADVDDLKERAGIEQAERIIKGM